MKNKTYIIAALLAGTAWTAYATEPQTAISGPPTLRFEETQLPSVGATARHVVAPYRIYDMMVVAVEDPVACGQQAVNPSSFISNGKLYLRYDLTSAAPGAKQCTLYSNFMISNVPRAAMDVYFAGGNEPFVVARLKTCPYYEPTSRDVYKCLVPAAQGLPRRLA